MEESCDIDGLLHPAANPLRESFKIWLWSVAASN